MIRAELSLMELKFRRSFTEVTSIFQNYRDRLCVRAIHRKRQKECHRKINMIEHEGNLVIRI